MKMLSMHQLAENKYFFNLEPNTKEAKRLIELGHQQISGFEEKINGKLRINERAESIME